MYNNRSLLPRRLLKTMPCFSDSTYGFHRYLAALLLVVATADAVSKESLSIAVASNFSAPAKSLIKAFRATSGHTVQASFASSGKLYAQTINGAPYDVFLSADQKTIVKLIDGNQAIATTQSTYAIGGLVLWSNDTNAKEHPRERLLSGNFDRLSLANPSFAPYGVAAISLLGQFSLIEKTRFKWVNGDNIAQAYQFVRTGNADLGFIAASQIAKQQLPKKVSIWRIPKQLHSPIVQDLVMLKRGTTNAAASQFLAFMKSQKAKDLIAEYGYQSPSSTAERNAVFAPGAAVTKRVVNVNKH